MRIWGKVKNIWLYYYILFKIYIIQNNCFYLAKIFYTNIMDSNHGYIISCLDDIIDQLKYPLANFIILIPNQFNI